MRCPTLSELPPPIPRNTGWPWTEETRPLPEKMPNGSPWPRISIATPSYNQRGFTEETIRSVVLQGYPDHRRLWTAAWGLGDIPDRLWAFGGDLE